MKPEIKNRMNDLILEQARQRYAIGADQLEELPAFESFMYGFGRDDGDYILRLGHSLRRTPDLYKGEVDWINYLAAGGAGVAQAILSTNGHLVEAIDDGQGEQFLATAFVRARGGHHRGWSDELIARYGRLMGRIHHLSQSYTVSDPAWKRPLWDNDVMLDVHAVLSNGYDKISAVYDTLMNHLQSLPQPTDGYGMIHQDAHAGNFFVDDAGAITLFDFDDCVYGHFVYDLAMVLFYAVTNRPDAAAFAADFWPKFWEAYRSQHALDPQWLQEMPQYMKLREIDLFAIIQRDIPPQAQASDGWLASFMNGRKERIEQEIPYLDYQF